MNRSVVVLVAALGAIALKASPAVTAGPMPSYIEAAVADPGRPAADTERDANRKPAEVLQFAGIKPGDRVLELFPGKGYFTRLFSKVVGSKGHVYAISPPRRPNAPPDSPDPVAATAAIAADANYSNVTAEARSPAALNVPERLDVVWTSQNYHDLHNIPNFDIAAFNRSVYAALKPGGLYIVLDHAAAAGSGVRDTSTLHRIDPKTVKSEVEAAGFVLVKQSDLLHNAHDPHTAKVFDPTIRGKTDQFIFKFRKPRGK